MSEKFNMTPTHLSDNELIEVTHRRMPSAQARALTQMGVPHKRRPDGTLLVGRTALERALCSVTPDKAQDACNGINWTKRA